MTIPALRAVLPSSESTGLEEVVPAGEAVRSTEGLSEVDQRRSLTRALLREAAFRLQPENWLPKSVSRPDESDEFESVRVRYEYWMEQSPFDTAVGSHWRALVDLAISYSAYTYRPEKGLQQKEVDALVPWYICFWKLDNLVDDATEHLPEGYLEELRQVMKQAWFEDEDKVQWVPKVHSDDYLAFLDQATALLLEHRRKMRDLGQPIENHPWYQQAVWNHIVCQTEPPPRLESLEQYMEMRRIRGGMECVLHMFLAIQGVEWDESFAEIADVTNIVTCLVDDLFSAPKDRRDRVVSSITICGSEGHVRVLETVRALHEKLLELLKYRTAIDGSVATHLFARTMLGVVLGMLDWQSTHRRYSEGANWLRGLLQPN
jgi:hypothetical protein